MHARRKLDDVREATWPPIAIEGLRRICELNDIDLEIANSPINEKSDL